MTAPVASPCVDICRMDEATGWCEGCLRTLDEIAAWSRLDNAARQEVCIELSRRRPQWRRSRMEAAQAVPTARPTDESPT